MGLGESLVQRSSMGGGRKRERVNWALSSLHSEDGWGWMESVNGKSMTDASLLLKQSFFVCFKRVLALFLLP